VNHDADLVTNVERLILELRPQRLLLIGSLAVGFAGSYGEMEPAADIQAVEAADDAALQGVRPSDLAVVIGGLESLPRGTIATLLGQLRDLYARRMLVGLDPTADNWTHRDMIGHGFVRLGELNGPSGPVRLYEFDIGTYKTTPDWLNSRNWANPRMFDKHRW
jgi:hypothetical protein